MSDVQGRLHSASELIAAIAAGKMVVLVDDEDRENEGDLVMAADAVSAEAINFMARFGRGLICLTLTEPDCRRLKLPLMVHENRSAHTTAFTVSIEAASGVTTGISAADRAHTIAVAVAEGSRPEDLVQPGHVFPLMAQAGGVLARAGHTEAGCDLAALAGRRPAAVICEILNDDGTMARLPQLLAFAQQHGLLVGSIADLIQYRSATESLVEERSRGPIELAGVHWEMVVYRDRVMQQPHIALLRGRPEQSLVTNVRVHEPLTAFDFFDAHSHRHSWPLPQALARLASDASAGVAVLINSAPSVDRVWSVLESHGAIHGHAQGRSAHSSATLRNYGVGAAILKSLGVGKMNLLAQPRKMPSMAGYGLEVVSYEQFEGAK